jgi:ribose 5-phosphate isomerase RpiB
MVRHIELVIDVPENLPEAGQTVARGIAGAGIAGCAAGAGSVIAAGAFPAIRDACLAGFFAAIELKKAEFVTVTGLAIGVLNPRVEDTGDWDPKW